MTSSIHIEIFEKFCKYIQCLDYEDRDEYVYIFRPDVHGFKHHKVIYPYGTYAKFEYYKDDDLLKIWILNPDKEEPDEIVKSFSASCLECF